MKRIAFFCGILMALVSSSGYAQSMDHPLPDVGAGKQRAAVCFACHSPEGISKIPGVPHLGGQDSAYLEKALHAYREGQQRQDSTMTAMARPLSDTDIVNIAAYYSLQTRMNNGQTAAQALELIERGRSDAPTLAEAPVVRRVAEKVEPASALVTRSGEAIYNATCIACHGSGAAGAPKLGDRAEWAPRIAHGNAVLLRHALQGYKLMPPRGTCARCTDAEIKAAVEFLNVKSR